MQKITLDLYALLVNRGLSIFTYGILLMLFCCAIQSALNLHAVSRSHRTDDEEQAL